MMRRRPSLTVVSLASACMLSRVRAFAIWVLAWRTAFLGSSDLSRVRASSTSKWAYQTSGIGIAANSRIAVR
jgi:hypothetical protein